jgi:plastocyanin
MPARSGPQMCVPELGGCGDSSTQTRSVVVEVALRTEYTMNRRRFLALGSASIAGFALVGCGSGGEETGQIEVTRIANVEGAPPTLAPNATPPSTSGGSGAASGGEQAPAGGGGGSQPIQLEARDPFAWSQTELQVAPSQMLVVTNVGALQHSFAVDEWGILEDLPNGQPVEIQVPQDAQVGQTLEFYCSVPGHREGGMVGTVTVIEAGQAGAASPQASPQGSPQATPVPEGPGGQGGQAGGGQPVQLEARDPFVWSPNQLNVTPGQTITATNVGVLEHAFAVDEWGIEEDLPQGQPVEIQVPQDAQAGQSFEFYCPVPGHREGGMVGTITVA